MIEPARFVVARHGNTFAAGDPPRRIGAATDLALTIEGEHQAVLLGRALAESEPAITAVLCGPLRRTARTAALAADELPARPTPVIVEWLREIDHGPDEGLAEESVRQRLGAAALYRWERDGVVPDGWPVERDVLLAQWRALFEASAAAATLIVTSSGIARFAALASGSVAGGSLKLRTGAYGEVRRDRAGALSCVSWDCRPGEAPYS